MEGIISFGRERKVTGKSRAKAHFWPDVNAFRRKFIPIVSIPAVVVSRLCRIFMRFVFLSARQQNYTECDHNVGNARAAIAIRWEGSFISKGRLDSRRKGRGGGGGGGEGGGWDNAGIDDGLLRKPQLGRRKVGN